MKRLSFKVITVLLCLIGLELSLQVIHLLMTLNHPLQEIQHQSFKILALGESTTDSHYLTEGGLAWPELLERQLTQAGFKVQVINQGRAAITSNDILASLAEDLERTKPNLVISMIGINDEDRWSVHVSDSPLKKLRLYRVLSWIHFSSQPFFHFENSNIIDVFPPKEYLDSHLQKLLTSEGDSQKQEISQLDQADQARLYTHWAMKENDPQKALEYYEKAFKDGYIVKPALGEYTYHLCKKQQYQTCRQVFERAIEEGIALNSFERMNAECCSNEDGQNKAWSIILNANSMGLSYYQQTESFKKNYQQIHSTLSKQSIPHIVMQYPLRELGPLKEFWTEEEAEAPLIVSNREFFLKALKTNSYNDLFIDRFAGDFGHTTLLGHKLIAQNLLQKILKEFSLILPKIIVEQSTQPESKDH